MSTVKDVLARNIEENIAPVIYFHQIDPDVALQEVREYVFTTRPTTAVNQVGGIHEQMVTLLNRIAEAIDKGHQLPASWISGYFGSGKSSFAKLLGLALDGMVLPNGQTMDQALLERDDTPNAHELKAALERLKSKVQSRAVIFDIGTHAKNNESIPHTVYREVLKKLGYSEHDGVAHYELALEDEGRYDEFLAAYESQNPSKPWVAQKDSGLAVQKFRAAYKVLYPDHGDLLEVGNFNLHSLTISQMVANQLRALNRRAAGHTLFIVVDEVSQYISKDHNKMLDLQSFVSDVGGKAKPGKSPLWLLVTGQEKLEEEARDSVLFKLQDRFPRELRVHLDRANVRDVVGRRLLKKKAGSELHAVLTDAQLDLLKLHAFECRAVTRAEVLDNYPLLPAHIPLFMSITQSIRDNSVRTQSDAGGVRSVLNNIWDLFNRPAVALKNRPLGTLVTLDMLYDVIGSSVDSDVQLTLAKIFEKHLTESWPTRVVKAIALLEMGAGERPVFPELLAQMLYPTLGASSVFGEVEKAIETLKLENWISFHEKTGWSVQNNAAQDWNRVKGDLNVSPSDIDDQLQKEQVKIMATVAQPDYLDTKFPLTSYWGFDTKLPGSGGPTQVGLCFHWATNAAKRKATDEWLARSRENAQRFHWVSGDTTGLEGLVRDLLRSQKMANKVRAQGNLLPMQTQLLFREQAEYERLLGELGKELKQVWLRGTVYFNGAASDPGQHGASFEAALKAEVEGKLPLLFHKFSQGKLKIAEGDFKQLLKSDVGGLSKVYFDGPGALGIAVNDGGRVIFRSTGPIPLEILQAIEENTYRTGEQLVDTFAAAPYGYSRLLIKSAVVGLLREEKVRLFDAGKTKIGSIQDPGAVNVFEQDKEFNRAEVEFRQPGGLTGRDKSSIRQFFERVLGLAGVGSEADELANLVFNHFVPQNQLLAEVGRKLNQLGLELPAELTDFGRALTECTSDRTVENALLRVKAKLPALEAGFARLKELQQSLTESTRAELRHMKELLDYHVKQLREVGRDAEVAAPIAELEAHWKQAEPWRAYADVKPAAKQIEDHYRDVRHQLHQLAESALQTAEGQLKLRPDFSKLNDDQTHAVLKVVRESFAAIDPDALQPGLLVISQAPSRIVDAGAKAHALVDKFLNEAGKEAGVRTVSLDLRNRIVASEAELDQVLARVKEKAMTELSTGAKVRFEE
ncbi:MAG: BREX system P-loop protein BrxC [Spirochaetales bacterium]